MKKITEVPVNYDSINNLDMRSLFEDADDQPLIYSFFHATGDISNEADEQGGEFYAIDVFNDDEVAIYQFLYNSLFEYEEDCRILGIGKFQEKYKIVARIEGQKDINDLRKFNLNNYRDGSDCVGEKEFETMEEAKKHLLDAAHSYFDRIEYSTILGNEISKICTLGVLQIGNVWARIEIINGNDGE
jgi:hypothetical protein